MDLWDAVRQVELESDNLYSDDMIKDRIMELTENEYDDIMITYSESEGYLTKDLLEFIRWAFYSKKYNLDIIKYDIEKIRNDCGGQGIVIGIKIEDKGN